MKYHEIFLTHLQRFCLKHGQWDDAQVVIAVSGGVDSMSLLWSIHQLKSRLKIKSIRALFIHHQTREGQDQDQLVVSQFCFDKNIPLSIFKMDWKEGENETNFESKARQKRYEIFHQARKENEWFFLGHHLDDALEWSFLQEWRSSSNLQLGMPLKREFFFRPFLCVSKNQILKLASSQQIPFREDPTNQSLKFQRNLLRKELIPPIKKNFPSLLKRYVQKQNEKLEILKKIKKPKQFIIPNSHVHLLGEAAVFELRQALHVLSKRGDWGEELKKVQLAQKNGKWGPMHLSHQIKVYLTPKHLLITQNHFDSKKSSYQKMTVKKLGENEKNYTKKDVKRLFYKYLSKANVHEFPFLVWIKNDKNSRVIKGDSIYNSMHLSKNHELHSPQWRIMPVSVLLSRWSDTDISLSLILPWGVE